MTRWQNLCHHDGLNAMEVLVIMNLAKDFLLYYLVLVGLDDLVRNGCACQFRYKRRYSQLS
jgi:hypothetical protein